MYWKVAFDSKLNSREIAEKLLFLGKKYSLLKKYCAFAIMNNDMNNYRRKVR
jgi:hypothetical protein